MSNFFGSLEVKLTRGPSQQPVASVAAGLEGKKYVLLAFCGKETPTSPAFTPNLRHFYDKFAYDKNFEVVFVPLDRSPEALSAYVESMHGDWLVMTFDSARAAGQQLLQEYKVDFPPAILVFENAPEGRKLITTVAREMIMHDEEAEKFPWPNGEADLRKYKRGLLINIFICIIIAMVIGYWMMRYKF